MFLKLQLLLWKNLILRKRRWILTCIEIVIPTILFMLIAYGRSQISGFNKVKVEATYTDPISEDLIFSNFRFGESHLWYAPNNNFTSNIITKLIIKFQLTNEVVKSFNSEEELLKYYAHHRNTTVAAVVFDVSDTKKLSYDIRIHEKFLEWKTNSIFLNTFQSFEDGSSNYIYKGFLSLQMGIDIAFMELSLGVEKLKNYTFTIQQFPNPPHIEDSGINELFMIFLPLITAFSFITLGPAVMKPIMEEKCSGIKEFMKMVGMKSWMSWLSWFVHALFSNFFAIIIIVVLMKVPFWGVSYAPIEHCDATVLFVFLVLYCMASIALCFTVASLFNQPTVAMVFIMLFWILSYFVPRSILTSYEGVSWGYSALFLVFPNMALHFGYSAISVYESRDMGVQWSNLFQSGSNGSNDITMGNVFVALLVVTVVFTLLAEYLDNIKPGDYGVSKPFYYPLRPLRDLVKGAFRSSEKVSNGSESTSLNVIEEGRGMDPCIEVRNLFKRYGYVTAVENLNMNFYKNQITVLLGTNGAGKSTTISMLTGMISATSGNILVNGKDFEKNLDEIRNKIGLCPQDNMLFPHLTVKEHLQFFGMLRNLSFAKTCQEADERLEMLGLLEKKDSKTSTLSGGMKRKLCLANALMGNSEILILDEPTSGMDPESRVKVVRLLKELKTSKTIIITTHFMDDADALADWIAIMASGHLQCYGTPLFLKKEFATGYNLTLTLKDISKDNIEKINNAFSQSVDKQISDRIKKIRGVGDTIVYVLPEDAKSQYPKILKALEASELGISKTEITVTTLTDVFLKVKSRMELKDQTDNNSNSSSTLTEGSRKSKITRTSTIRSLLLKRCYFLKRKWPWFFLPTTIAIIIFAFAIYLGHSTNENYFRYGEPSLSLTLEAYGPSGVVFGGNANPKLLENYENLVKNQKSIAINAKHVPEEIVLKGGENIAYYKKHMIAAAEFQKVGSEIEVNALYSPSALHGAPISVNLVMNAVLVTLLDERYSIRTNNTPLKAVYSDVSPSEMSDMEVAVYWLIFVPIAMLIFMTNFITFPNAELPSNFFKQQIMAGLRPYCYWMVNIAFDFVICFIVVIVCSCLLFATFDAPEYRILVEIFLLYCFCCLPYVYLFSYKDSMAKAASSFLITGMLLGVIPTLVVIALEEVDKYPTLTPILRSIFHLLCPQFTLSIISVKFVRKYVENYNWKVMVPNKKHHICHMSEDNFQRSPCCDGDGTLECRNHQTYYNHLFTSNCDIFFVIGSFVLYFVLLCFLESKEWKTIMDFVKNKRSVQQIKHFFNKVKSKPMLALPTSGSTMFDVTKIKKSFNGKQAVKDVSFSLKKNECLGLLGVNGAGKTTTFQMLTQEVLHDDGTIFANEISVGADNYLSNLGYCPQFDCLNLALSGRDLLYTFAGLRGLEPTEAEEMTAVLLKLFDLDKYGNKPCAQYSGGNKRKLSTCLAFISFPEIILLDEPTNGVDPASRIQFWEMLADMKIKTASSFVLCSHSMEECETLCDRLAIMKEGKIVENGTMSELRSKFENGYAVVIKLNSGDYDTVDGPDSTVTVSREDLKTEITDKFNNEIEFKNDNMNLLEFHLPKDVKLSDIFAKIENLKNENCIIVDYTVSQTSLEDIFLNIAENN